MLFIYLAPKKRPKTSRELVSAPVDMNQAMDLINKLVELSDLENLAQGHDAKLFDLVTLQEGW